MTPTSTSSQPSTSNDVNVNVDAYLQSLTPKERKAYHIAHTHLGTSFDINKSVGYLAYVQRMSITPN